MAGWVVLKEGRAGDVVIERPIGRCDHVEVCIDGQMGLEIDGFGGKGEVGSVCVSRSML